MNPTQGPQVKVAEHFLPKALCLPQSWKEVYMDEVLPFLLIMTVHRKSGFTARANYVALTQCYQGNSLLPASANNSWMPPNLSSGGSGLVPHLDTHTPHTETQELSRKGTLSSWVTSYGLPSVLWTFNSFLFRAFLEAFLPFRCCSRSVGPNTTPRWHCNESTSPSEESSLTYPLNAKEISLTRLSLGTWVGWFACFFPSLCCRITGYWSPGVREWISGTQRGEVKWKFIKEKWKQKGKRKLPKVRGIPNGLPRRAFRARLSLKTWPGSLWPWDPCAVLVWATTIDNTLNDLLLWGLVIFLWLH